MQIKLGYELVYECPQPTPMLLVLSVHSYPRCRSGRAGPLYRAAQNSGHGAEEKPAIAAVTGSECAPLKSYT